MAEILVPSVNGTTGKLDPAVIPSPASIGAATAAQGTLAGTAVQPGALAAVATSGSYNDLTNKPPSGPQQFTWHFPGTLLVRSGMAFIYIPQDSVYTGKRIHLLYVSATLGTVAAPTTDATANTVCALLVNRAVFQALTLAYTNTGGVTSALLGSLAGSTLNPSDVLSVDVTQVPTLPRTTPSGDLTVTVWYEWV